MMAAWGHGVNTLKRFCVDRPQLKSRIKRVRYGAIRSVSLAAGAEMDERPRMIGYHAIGEGQDDLSVSVGQFRQQLDWLLEHRFRVLTVRQWWQMSQAGKAVPPRSVILSFDDGFRSVSDCAAPLLAERGMPASVFLILDYIGRSNAYDQPFLHRPESPLLDWPAIERLQRAGWDFQSHTRRHLPVSGLPEAILAEEVAGSRQRLSSRLGASVDFFCYPYGAFDAAALQAVRQAGYAAAFTCWSGVLPHGIADDPYRLPRTLVDGLMSLQDFAAIFRQGYVRLAQGDGWLRRTFGSGEHCPFDEWDKIDLEAVC